MDYQIPKLTVDGILIQDNMILLIKRRFPPFQGIWALPGGFVEYGETVEKAVIREMKEETGLETKIQHLLGVYSDPKRDPRGHTISVVYLLTSQQTIPKNGDDAADAKFFNLKELPSLAFDHEKIIRDAIESG